jgi:Uma2 family endonuclease
MEETMVVQIKPQVTPTVALPTKPWPPPQGEWTYDDFLRLEDDGWRYEVIRGELYMTPPPSERHQFTSMNLSVAFYTFVKSHKLGRVYTAPFGVILGDIATPVQPDIVFVAAERLATVVTEDGLRGAPDLIVEILSPSNWLTDRRTKFELYQEAGVREYWLVNPKTCVAEVYVLRDGEFTLLERWGAGEVARSEVLAGFQVALNEVCGME